MDFELTVDTLVNSATLRGRRYRITEKGKVNNTKVAAKSRADRASRIPEFIGVDSEGIGRGAKHRAVLLGVGSKQYEASDLKKGLTYEEVFTFLYEQYKEHPTAAFVGFYLAYDFNNWLKTLPINAAHMLLSKEGRKSRQLEQRSNKRRTYHPVRVPGWEIDMMGFKRLSIRPIPEGCKCGTRMVKCTVKHPGWMHICDAGPFFQMSFLNVIDEKNWKDDPDGWPLTQAEYDKIKEGKNRRAHARLDKGMRYYNALENELLARVMERLARGFARLGIKLAKDQWYGPGAAASNWLRKHDAPTRRVLTEDTDSGKRLIPEYFWDACRCSYFGGWFEIFSHGIIEGKSNNYDINNAYPYAATKVPHICSQCNYSRGAGDYEGQGEYVLLYATVFTAGNRIGAMPHRDKSGSILRPSITKGWYWKAEIDAARRAGLVKKVMVREWTEFIPCDHPAPFTEIADLYQKRLDVGKNSALGLAIKNTNNSLYGKFAQSVGGKPYNNWFYASLITSHCRIQILDSIATHPGGVDSVLMVATDGICFDSPHKVLDEEMDSYCAKNGVSKDLRLGKWARDEYTDLCLFKPGVYWHTEGKKAVPEIKSRGVPKDQFADAIKVVEHQFRLIHDEGSFPGRIITEECFEFGGDIAFFRSEQGWPHFWVPVTFRMKSCLQALSEGQWETAGMVQEDMLLKQDSDPGNKRRAPRYNLPKRRIDTIIHDLPIKNLETHYHGDIKFKTERVGFTFDGPSALTPITEIIEVLRDKGFELDKDTDWINVWDGGQ